MFGGVLVKVVGGVVAIGAVGTAVAVGVASAGGPDEAVVTRVVDGDTIDVTIDGGEERVRLLNIDTPESVDPDRPVECLSAEATAFLEGLLPTGTAVRLEYDAVRTDRYDRTLAGVFTGDGTLVNAEIARAGLAAVVVFDDNVRFLPPVEDARAEAEAEGVGLYSAEVACTIPAQVAALEEMPAVVDPSPDAPSTEFVTAAAAVGGIVGAADRLRNLLGDTTRPALAVFGQGDRDRFVERVTAVRTPAGAQRAALQATAGERQQAERLEAARLAEEARQAEQARIAAEAEQARVAAEAEQERQAEQERARSAERERERERASAPAPSSGGGGGGAYPGYTGPRCYEPGGRVWHPC